MNPLLTLRDVHVSYGKVKAVSGLSLEVHPGEIVSLLGSNGAGKTSTIRAILNVVRPSGGEIHFKGRRIDTLPTSAIVRMGISVVPEGRRLFPKMTVVENLRMGCVHERNEAVIAERMEWVFELFPRLRERANQLAGTLSGGEQSMVAIGRGLMGAPDMLLLDEPSLGLAPRLVSEFFELIQRINKEGTTILLIEQNAAQALAIASRGYVLEKGRLVASGTAQELLEADVLSKAYLHG